MGRHGSSVTLTWAEDTNAWECAWITSGRRFVGVDRSMNRAVERPLVRVREEIMMGQKQAPLGSEILDELREALYGKAY